MDKIYSSSFGLVIAFLLPGFIAFYGMINWIGNFNIIYNNLFISSSFLGAFSLIIVISLILGLIITSIKWVLYENILDKSQTLDDNSFKDIGSNRDKLIAFRAAVDEHYRYHQFWSNTSIAIFPSYVHIFIDLCNNHKYWFLILSLILVLSLEILLFFSAKEAKKKYIIRAKAISKGT